MARRLLPGLAALACSAVLALPGLAAAATSSAGRAGSEPVVVQVRGGGFHWGDAAAGAAASLGAVLVAAGALALRRPHRDSRRRTNA